MELDHPRIDMITGGMINAYPLKNVAVNPTFFAIIAANFEIEQVPDIPLYEFARHYLDGLFEPDDTVLRYIGKQKLLIGFSWAEELSNEGEHRCGPCLVEMESEAPLTFKALLPKEYADMKDFRSINSVALYPVGSARNDGRVLARLTNYDPVNFILYFTVAQHSLNRITEGAKYDVQFRPCAFQFRSQDRTLENLMPEHKHYLVFPKLDMNMITVGKFTENARQFETTAPFAETVPFNAKQKEAIYAIVSGIHGKVPYLLHGPPGTGKTTILVEACRQLLTNGGSDKKEAKILVCTPSNTAADLFASQLLNVVGITHKDILRLYSLTRSVDHQPQELYETMWIANDEEGDKVFGIPSKEVVLSRRVVISTLSTSTYLVSGMLRGEFTHIMIDEAGQASEVDTLIPMVGLAEPSTKIILAGDTQQLGPVETVEFLNSHNLTKSLLERYEVFEFYKDDPRLTCMLEENYRSHADIIKVSSDLFYGGKLISSDPDAKTSLCNWDELPTKGFPLIWHHIEGVETKEIGGHSFCNESEIELVRDYVHKITSTTDVQDSQIGVISPYRYQVKKLQRALQEDHPEITVDSVERYQGSERRVIIVSTVRNGNIGFLDDGKRFNTTITRAQELLIIVGNRRVLTENAAWENLADFIADHGAVLNDNSPETYSESSSEDKPENLDESKSLEKESASEAGSHSGQSNFAGYGVAD